MMRPSGVLVTTILAFLALAATVWIGKYKADPENLKASIGSVPKVEPVGPAISPTGPYPKAVVDETEYNFGAMTLGSEGAHKFVIRNEGDADLEVIARKEDTTCSCTFGELSDNGKIPPGGSVDVTLNWKIKFATETFRHRAIVRSNDPEYKEIELAIVGNVTQAIRVKPEGGWPLGELATAEPAVIEGEIFSEVVDSFEITGYETLHKFAQAEWTPMSAEALQENQAKSGYTVKVKVPVAPQIPLGTFRDTLTFSLSGLPTSPKKSESAESASRSSQGDGTETEDAAEQHSKVAVEVTGVRPGPMQILGPGFNSDANAVLMGEFPASEGKSVTLSIFVRDLDEDLVLLGEEQTFDSVKLELTKDPKAIGNAQRYFLKVTVLPGDPVNRLRKQSEKINLKFNHPQAPSVRLFVEYLAT